MPTIEVLVGMVASGKSTYAQRRADDGALVVCHDDLTEMLHARYRYEPELRECYRKMEVELGLVVMEAGRDLIIDRTHLTRESRLRWIQIGQLYEQCLLMPVPLVAVVFPIETPYIHAQRRFDTDHRGRLLDEWWDVANHHFEQAQAEPLSADEGFAEIRHVTPERSHP